MRRSFWAVVLILLIAMSLRLHDLETRSLWADEGWTLVLSEGPTIPDIVQRMAFDQHPPLYFVAIHLWRDATGSTEFALRMLSVLTGILGVAGIFQLGRAMFGPTTGVMAAFFFALSDHHIDLCQDVRHYAQLATLIILSTWYYFRLFNNPTPSRGTRIGYVLTSVALLYSHYLGGFVLICQAAHMVVFLRPWSRLRWAMFHFGAVCLAFVPWSLVVYNQNQVRWITPLYYLNSLSNSHETYIMVRDALLGQQYAITLVLILVGLVWLSYRGKNINISLHPIGPTAFILLWLVGYATMTYVMNSREGRQFLTIRNFIVMTPGIALLAGHGLANLQLGVRLFMLSVLLAVSLTTVDTRQIKPPWREVVQTITRHHNPGEPVLMDIWVGDFPGRYYVEQQMGPDTPWLSLREARDEYVTEFQGAVLTYIRDRQAFWVIYWRSQPIEEMNYAGNIAQAGFMRSASFTTDHIGNQIYTYRYDKLPDEPITTYGDLFSLWEYRLDWDRDQLSLQLLWTAQQQPLRDYSFSVFLLDANNTAVFNQDGQPQSGNAPTTSWQSGQPIFDPHQLTISLSPGTYTVGIKVYYYQTPNEPLQIDCEAGKCDWLEIGQINVN